MTSSPSFVHKIHEDRLCKLLEVDAKGQVLLHQPLRRDHGSHGSCMSGLGGIPSAWRSPTTRCPGGNILAPPSAELAMFAPGHRVVALGEVDGMSHLTRCRA
jgi:hypothetical protein